MDNYISIQEAARLLNTSEEFFRARIRSGELATERDPTTPWLPHKIRQDVFEAWRVKWFSQFEFEPIKMPVFADSEIRFAESGWFAGILDGEGHIGILRQQWKKKWGDKQGFYVGAQPIVQVAMTDEICVRKCRIIAGCGDVKFDSRKNRLPIAKPVWTWRAANQQATFVLRAVIPFLVGKRRQAELVLRAAHLNFQYRHGLRAPKNGGRRPEDLEELHRICDELFTLQGRRALRI